MEPEKKSNGALVGLVVIIIILVLGGVYIWQSNKNTLEKNPANSETVTNQDSTDLNTLDQDLNTIDIDVGANVINSVE
ncbi:MAG: hypothetical protein AAB595_00300 [Patescibacteria group bacterium]